MTLLSKDGVELTGYLTRCSAEQADDLRDLGRLFLFTQDQKLSLDRPEGIFKNIWTMPASQELHSILD